MVKKILLTLLITTFLIFLENSSADATINRDLDLIDLQVLQVVSTPVDDKPRYPYDNSNLLKLQFNITNIGLDYFVLSDKMFRIQVLDRSYPYDQTLRDEFYMVDNYWSVYDVELETRYDDYYSFELFEDCEYLHDRIFISQTETVWVCFDILQRWNNEVLNLEGPKEYYLTMFDNFRASSCPNCKRILLSSSIGEEGKIESLSPYKQVHSGITSENVICKEGLELVLKQTNNFPACVTPKTAKELKERGWS